MLDKWFVRGYTFIMKTKKFFKKIEKLIQDRIDEAYSEGFNDGFDNATGDIDIAYRNGIEAERERVIGLFKMLSEENLVSGSATKAKSWRAAADLVDVANHLEKLDWSQEAIDERYQEELEKDGF